LGMFSKDVKIKQSDDGRSVEVSGELSVVLRVVIIDCGNCKAGEGKKKFELTRNKDGTLGGRLECVLGVTELLVRNCLPKKD